MIPIELNFTGKSAVVTGASRGIGLAVADALEAAGASVSRWSRATGVDLADRERRRALSFEADLFVHCAGNQESAPALEYSAATWDRELDLNLTAAFDLARAVAPSMLRKRWGRIVFMSSIAGIQGTRGIVGYSVAKAGIVELTKCLSNEWAADGVTVNCLAPGYIDTEMLRPLTSDEARSATTKGRIPAGRFGDPREVAAAVVFLCSEHARYITGAVLPVDGGWLGR